MEKLLLALKIVTLCIVLLNESVAEKCVLNLIVAVPNHHEGHKQVPSWERGEEILSGARIVAEKISNKTECQLELIEVDNGICGRINNFNFLQQLFAQLMSTNHNQKFIGVLGLSCNAKFNFVIPSLSSNIRFRNVPMIMDLMSTNVTLDQKSSLIRALFKFMKVLNWQKLGVITETGDTYFSRIAEILYREAKHDHNIDIVSYLQLQTQTNKRVTSLIQNIRSKVTFISVNLQTTVAILCSAYQNKMLWPNHVWILHSYLLMDVLNVQAMCNITEALEYVLFIREQKEIVHQEITYEDFSIENSLQNNHNTMNPYINILDDLILSTLLRLFNINVLANDSQPQYGITHYYNASEVPISVVIENNITVIDSQIRKIATVSDEFEIRFEGSSTEFTIICSIEILIGFVFVTIMLIAYIYFRNEPEVKSTSFMLSLFIFLGCYINLIFLSLLLYLSQPIPISQIVFNSACGIIPWISGLGISTSLIIATVLVKLARVYHIFNRMTPKPLGKKSSDLFLAGYVLLILSPLIAILTSWTVIDRFKITFHPSFKSGFTQRQCVSSHLIIWLPLLVLNVVALFLVLMIVALKSRHIRKKHFRHTRQVNMFIFCLFFNIVISLSYWWLLETLGTSMPLYIAGIPLHIGHFGIVVLCQLFLIVPKLLMPLSRCLCGNII